MLKGNLAEMELPQVLQLLAASSQSGCLILQQNEPVAWFYFKIGQLSHCECLVKKGQESVNGVVAKGVDGISAACSYRNCNFRFDNEVFCEEESLSKYPTDKLIASIDRFIQKRRQRVSDLIEKDTVVLYEASDTLGHFKASQQELALLLLANGKRSVVEIAEVSNCTIRQVQDWAARFISNGLLKVVKVDKSSEKAKDQLAHNGAAPSEEAKRQVKQETKPVRYWRGKPID
jgi:hypothetical protein